MSALANPTRMRVLALLLDAGAGGMGSSEMADAVKVPRNLMSSHLAILSKVGAIRSEKTGRRVVYTVVAHTIRALSEYLGDLVAD